MKKLLKYFSIFEWCLYIAGVITVILCFVLFENKDVFNLIGSLIGITALIFLSKGNPIGLILSIVFSVFYGVVSWSYKYYGEMITYLLMTTPISIASLVSWFKNPYKGNKAEVEINEISKKEVENVELKDVALPEEMKRVIAKAAEAEREKQAVITKAQGEVEASQNLAIAAENLAKNPVSVHLRTLETINDLSSDQSNTVVFALLAA